MIELHLDPDLEMVPGRGLVEGDGGNLVEQPIVRLVGVQVVLGLPRSVDAGWHVEGGRRLLLAVVLHRQDHAVRLGKPAEEAGSGREGALRLLLCHADEGLRIVGVVGRVVRERRVERDAIRVPQAARNRVLVPLDPLQVVQAKGVDLIGTRIKRGLHPDRKAVHLLAARRGGDAGHWPRVGLVLIGQEVAVALNGGIQGLVGRIVHAVARRIVGDLRDPDRRVVLGGNRQHAVDLLDRPAHGDGGGRAAVGDPFAQRPDLLVNQGRVAGVAGEELLQALGRVRLLVLGDQHGHRLDAPDVIDGQLVELALLRLEPVAGDQHQHVPRDHLLGIEAVAADRLGLRQHLSREVGFLGATLGTEVRQTIVVAIVAQDGGLDRIELQDLLPEAIGELVDERVRISDSQRGTSRGVFEACGGGLGSRGMLRVYRRACSRPSQDPKRSASSAGGVSSSWS